MPTTSQVEMTDQHLQPKEDKVHAIIRVAQNKITAEGDDTQSTEASVPYSKLYCLATSTDLALLYFGWASACITGLGLPSFVFLFGDVLDAFGSESTPEEILEEIEWICLIFLLIGVGILIFGYFFYALLLIFSERVAKRFKVAYLSAILRQEVAWFDLKNFQELSSRIGKEVLAIQKALGEKYGTIIFSLAMCFSGLFFAFLKGWKFTFVVFGGSLILGVSTSIQTAVVQQGYEKTLKAYGQSAGYAEQALNAIRIVLSFGQQEQEVKNYTRHLEEVKEQSMKTHFKNSFAIGFFLSSIFGVYAFSFFMGTIFIYKDVQNSIFDRSYTAGDVLTCFFGVVFGMFSLGLGAPNIKAIAEGRAAGKQAFDVIDRVSSIDPYNSKCQRLRSFNGDIEFKNVDFFYPSRPEQKILDNFSAKFERGRTTAIVGPSGSGKSTIVQLIERFYDPENGEVLVDGLNMKEVNLQDFRRFVGYVGQEPVLFNTSVRENIKFGKPDATDDEIISALKKARAYDFVFEKKEGLDLQVGAQGGQLSGGQKQRLAIARAFVKHPKVLLFDEATSALDKKNEAKVQEAIDNIRVELGEVTTIVIAHRLTTIINADKILVMKKGVIVETGTHKSLLEDHPDGTYSKFFKQQQNQEGGSGSSEKRTEEVKDPESDTKQQETSAKKMPETAFKTNIGDEEDAFIQSPDEKVMEQELGDGDSVKDAIDRASRSASAVKQRVAKESLVQKKNVDEMERVLSIDSIEMETHREATKQPEPEEPEKPKMSAQELAIQEKMRTDTQDAADKKLEDEIALIQKENNEGKFFKRLWPYNKPHYLIFVGFSFSSMAGCVFPIFAVLLTKSMFKMMIPFKELMWEEANKYNLGMFILAVIAFFLYFTGQFIFKKLGENITLEIRRALYKGLLQKDAGFFDERDNSAGVLTVALASDVQKLNGASTEGSAVMIETTVAMVCGLILCFYYDWRISLVAFAMSPLMVFGNYVNAMQQQGMSEFDNELSKEANILCGESISNFRTIMSFGTNELLIQKYDELLTPGLTAAVKKAHFIGVMYGFSQFVQNAIFSALYYAMAKFNVRLAGETNPMDQMIAIMAMFYGAAAAGNASQFGPDMGKAMSAGKKIFNILDTPSKTDMVDKTIPSKRAVPEKFEGKIEFRDVWFRYPTRKDQWVFKGLNLVIEPNESIAIVGESGSGKSTFVNLVLRFYDPDAGTVLVDDVDIREYDVAEYRRRLGLVMQEPTLFNYSIKENILYGKLMATNSELISCSKVANAIDFIEDTHLQDDLIDDSPQALLQSFEQKRAEILKHMSLEDYEKKIEALKKIQIKLKKQGTFEYEQDIFDLRSAAQKDVKLHPGFDTNCGIRGGKLSGGQKQRIAIARAVVRAPSILLLDEATSALDEESQRKVQEALENVMEGRTSIVIAHRLTTIEKCSRIACLEDGNIVESGSFTNLQTKGGFFSHLAKGLEKTKPAEEQEAQE